MAQTACGLALWQRKRTHVSNLAYTFSIRAGLHHLWKKHSLAMALTHTLQQDCGIGHCKSGLSCYQHYSVFVQGARSETGRQEQRHAAWVPTCPMDIDCPTPQVGPALA